MKRRNFLSALTVFATAPVLLSRAIAGNEQDSASTFKVIRTGKEWQDILTDAQYRVLRREGTERPWTSPLNDEKRKGTFVCAGCDQPLFTSDMKYDSGTGWPSFHTVIEGAVGTKRDFKMLVPRTEYHCSNCGGHHGHIFNDGPEPTGLRYCNNGVALKFIPQTA